MRADVPFEVLEAFESPMTEVKGADVVLVGIACNLARRQRIVPLSLGNALLILFIATCNGQLQGSSCGGSTNLEIFSTYALV